jgi:hypothetical protein
MLYRRGKTWHYDLTVAGRRQRGTTRQTSESRARKVESKLIEEAERRGPSAVLRRAPLLCYFAPRFLEWVDHARPEVAPLLPRGVESDSLYGADANESGPHHHKKSWIL